MSSLIYGIAMTADLSARLRSAGRRLVGRHSCA